MNASGSVKLEVPQSQVEVASSSSELAMSSFSSVGNPNCIRAGG